MVLTNFSISLFVGIFSRLKLLFKNCIFLSISSSCDFRKSKLCSNFSKTLLCLFCKASIISKVLVMFLLFSCDFSLKLIIRSITVLYCLSSVCNIYFSLLKLHFITELSFNILYFFSGYILKSKYSRFFNLSIVVNYPSGIQIFLCLRNFILCS